MKPLCRLFAISTLSLLAVGAYAQVASPAASQFEPGTTSTQVSPASAAPQTQTQPNLRTDSMPHTNQDASTDSGPAPETLGVDATPLMDLDQDWSLPQTSEQPSMLKKIVTHKQQVSVVEVQTLPARTLPVTNPPLPPVVTILNIPPPPVRLVARPQDPLAGIPQ